MRVYIEEEGSTQTVVADVPDTLLESRVQSYEALCELLDGIAALRKEEAAKSTLAEAPPPE